MPTVVEGSVPADEFALYETLSSIPDVEFECERIVESGDGVVMPLLWGRGAEYDTVSEAFEDDPAVDNVSLLADYGDEWLVRMDWIESVQLVVHMLTNAQATILEARGEGEEWSLRVMYPTRDELSMTHEFCESHGVTFDVSRIRDMEGNPSAQYGLTAEQHEALKMAHDRGYFQVPRKVDLDDLAEELDISHQALSERLRRAQASLVEDTLIVGAELN
jgi:predicted DNA binding protein